MGRDRLAALAPGGRRDLVEEVNTPSPIAVRVASVRFSSASIAGCRSCDGGAATVVWPAKVTTPTSKPSGRPSTKRTAAREAASSRLGSTSVASIDRETSTATTTVARSRGTRTSASGRPAARASSTKDSSSSEAGRWRRQRGRRGTSRSSIGSEAKRTAYALRRRCWTT